jgi:hypothetical protein
MNAKDNHPLHAAINAKLAQVAERSPTLPAWYEPWIQLGPESSQEQRLAVYQAVRDSGLLPEEAGFYLVSWQIDAMVSQQAEESLRDLDERLDAIKEAHGLDVWEPWPAGAEPAEYREAFLAYQQAWDELFLQALHVGEQDMARLFTSDRPEFDRRSEAGRQYFHGDGAPRQPNVPPWLDSFVELVGSAIEAESAMGPLGYWWSQEEGLWEVTVFPTPVELVGGSVDGAVIAPGFHLDLEQLRAAFERVVDFGWNALGVVDPDGPHVWLEGIYEGQEIFMRILAEAPEDEEPGLKLDTTGRRP